MNLFKIAWRNLWRNRRRTSITSASILFAVFFALIMRSFQLGFYDHMIRNVIESFSGFLQLQHVDYQDDPSLENTFSYSAELQKNIETMPGITAVVPRIETFALASTGIQTKGALIMGIDPVKERSLSNPENLLVRYRITRTGIDRLESKGSVPQSVIDKLMVMLGNSYTNTGTIAMDLELDEKEDWKILDAIAAVSRFPGRYLENHDNGVLVSDRLAKYLRLSVADTLILMGQGYHGATAADLYPVRGIIKLVNPELDNKIVYMDLSSAQAFTGVGKKVTAVGINLADNSDKNMLAMQRSLAEKLKSGNITVKNWKEFNPVLVQQIEGDNQSGKAFLALLYFVIFFGIFGTVLMMIHERHREFGVMVSIGMRKTKLALMMVIEMFLMGILGVISGTVISLPILYYFHIHPVRLTGGLAQTMEDMGFDPLMPLAWTESYIIWQGLVVALMVVLSCLYPLRKVLKLKEVEALRD